MTSITAPDRPPYPSPVDRLPQPALVCIAGAGAIGGWVGARLAGSGHRTTALARGATRDALRAHGWRLQSADGLLQAPVLAVHEQADALLDATGAAPDLLVVAVKGPALPALAPQLAPLIGPQTVVVPMMNGVPWWFCAGQPGWPGGALQSVDPGGHIAAHLPLQQVLGAVVHAGTASPEPGLVVHRMGQGLIVGEPGGGTSPRAQALAALLCGAGFEATASDNVRRDIWFKLWGNMTMNPVSALTGAPLNAVLADPLVRGFCSLAMQEAAALGARLGCPIDQAPETRHAMTAKLGAFKTSMLQDTEAGRPLELDALIGAVHEIAQRLGLPTPHIDALFGLARLFARQRGLYPPA